MKGGEVAAAVGRDDMGEEADVRLSNDGRCLLRRPLLPGVWIPGRTSARTDGGCRSLARCVRGSSGQVPVVPDAGMSAEKLAGNGGGDDALLDAAIAGCAVELWGMAELLSDPDPDPVERLMGGRGEALEVRDGCGEEVLLMVFCCLGERLRGTEGWLKVGDSGKGGLSCHAAVVCCPCVAEAGAAAGGLHVKSDEM